MKFAQKKAVSSKPRPTHTGTRLMPRPGLRDMMGENIDYSPSVSSEPIYQPLVQDTGHWGRVSHHIPTIITPLEFKSIHIVLQI